MKEIQAIIQAFEEAQQQGKQTALATVVHVQGSSYRRPGARMLITQDGMLTGAISGGCLEGDALRKALLVMARQEPMLVTYDTTDEDDAKLGVGLGCEGIIHIVIEPILPAQKDNPIQLLKTISLQRQHAALVMLFSLNDRREVQPGTCLLQLPGETVTARLTNDALQKALTADAKTAFVNQVSATKTYVSEGKQFTAFIELIKPAVSVIIIGAGNDAMPVAQMANLLGWQVTVADGRQAHATAARFPTANQVLVTKPDQVIEQVTIDAQTVFVLMTHNYNYDLKVLRQLIIRQITYIGMLGPRKKLVRMLDELKAEGIVPTPEQLASIFGPVGLNIGAENAEEIALSIVAEIKAVIAGRTGESLRNSADTIHPRVEKEIEEVKISQ
ncbi:XdhC family protein [Niastella caeni]|uniref:XdhC family protein n=1 Tax=Niastella caeni TaxID=2569763 RepID=A0A4S8HBE0_9BACT|nr:XdhC/CoxI family protein [Niastella caeni]THU31551.1 XdhC family protein [Niastella caeni]